MNQNFSSLRLVKWRQTWNGTAKLWERGFFCLFLERFGKKMFKTLKNVSHIFVKYQQKIKSEHSLSQISQTHDGYSENWDDQIKLSVAFWKNQTVLLLIQDSTSMTYPLFYRTENRYQLMLETVSVDTSLTSNELYERRKWCFSDATWSWRLIKVV